MDTIRANMLTASEDKKKVIWGELEPHEARLIAQTREECRIRGEYGFYDNSPKLPDNVTEADWRL